MLPATACYWRRSSIPWNEYRRRNLLLFLEHRRTSTGGVRIPLLDEGGRDVSFEEIRTLTFLLRKRRLLTVNIRLPNSRTSTLRFGMRETCW